MNTPRKVLIIGGDRDGDVYDDPGTRHLEFTRRTSNSFEILPREKYERRIAFALRDGKAMTPTAFCLGDVSDEQWIDALNACGEVWQTREDLRQATIS